MSSEGKHDIEFTLGRVTLDVFDPSWIGQPFAPSPAGFALRVGDAGRAGWKGVVFYGETIETSVCKQAWFKDPDGNVLMLHRRVRRRDRNASTHPRPVTDMEAATTHASAGPRGTQPPHDWVVSRNLPLRS